MTVILTKEQLEKMKIDLDSFINKKHRQIGMNIEPIPKITLEQAKEISKKILEEFQSKSNHSLGDGVGVIQSVSFVDRLQEIENNHKHELDVYDDNSTDIWLGDLDYLIKEAKKARDYENKLNQIEDIVNKSSYVYNAIYEIVYGKSVLDESPRFQVKEKMLDIKLSEGNAKPKKKFFDDWND
jgi:hypothetical protein